MFNKDNIICTLMTISMLSVIACGVTLFGAAFFVKEAGVEFAVAMPIIFGVVAMVSNAIVNRMEKV